MAVHGVGHGTCPAGPFMTPELCNDDLPYAIFLLIQPLLLLNHGWALYGMGKVFYKKLV